MGGNDNPDPPNPATVVSPEQEAVRKHRYQEAKNAGLTKVEALLFADSDADVGLLRKLVKGGATPDQMRRVLL